MGLYTAAYSVFHTQQRHLIMAFQKTTLAKNIEFEFGTIFQEQRKNKNK
jgi:alpha-amylase/alpha-mannosidase (GH57 family)